MIANTSSIAIAGKSISEVLPVGEFRPRLRRRLTRRVPGYLASWSLVFITQVQLRTKALGGASQVST
jgi:hypothetical protein